MAWFASYKAPPNLPLWPFSFWQGLMCNCWSQLVSCKFPTSGNGEEQQLGGQLRTDKHYGWKVKQGRRSGSSRKMQRHHSDNARPDTCHTHWQSPTGSKDPPSPNCATSKPITSPGSCTKLTKLCHVLHCHGDPPPCCGRAQGLKEEKHGVARQEVTWASWSWCCFCRFPGPRSA